MSILNEYVCTVPFNYLEIHKDKVYGCCPSWLSKPYGTTDKLSEVWNGDIATNVRKSVLDGTYSYCDKNNCPYLSQLINFKQPLNYFLSKSNFNLIASKGPNKLSLCFDSSCNLSCPSCRKNAIMANKEEVESINNLMNDISILFRDSVYSLNISGTCDPFASKTFRNFLKDFDLELFPKLTDIHLQTNGLLLDEKMWKSIEKSHKYITTIDVSIDAATKKTYEKIRGGDWNKLIDNLIFISSIPTINFKVYSFVVQDNNYKEMYMFYDLIANLQHKQDFNVSFIKILNWGTYTNEEYIIKQIWNEQHPDFNDFLIELAKVSVKYNSSNNMNDIVEKYKLIKTIRLI